MKIIRQTLPVAAAIALAIGIGAATRAQQQNHEGYKDTPLLPGGKWHVHDPDRPQPPVVEPGTASTPDMPGKAPSDATVLFDGSDLSKWSMENGADPTWVIDNGSMHRPMPPAKGGYVYTKQAFGDCQLHVEFSEPTPAHGSGQGRGNSGVFFHDGTYEIQVLDSYDNTTYADGGCAAVYGQSPPLVNASRKPGEWQSYDIVWTSPRWADGKLQSPAYVTVIHNGIIVQNHVALNGPTGHRVAPPYAPHDIKGRIALQDHGDVVRFRNVWVREIALAPL